jgi:hypothetical protein
MKYKICKLVNGNTKTWYQIKIKGWLFWRWIKVARGPLEIAYYEPITFRTFKQAEKYVKDLQKCKEYGQRARQIKTMECVEI